MWTRKELKKNARLTVRQNYLACISACFLVIIFAGASSNSGSGAASVGFLPHSDAQSTNASILGNFLENQNFSSLQTLLSMAPDSLTGEKGLLGNLFSNTTRSGSFLFGILNIINESVFNNSIASGIIAGVGSVLQILYWATVGNFLTVGLCRFFLESKNYKKTPSSRITFVFKIRRIGKVAKGMCLRLLTCTLWFLTIVGGFVEVYATYLVPHILAENPDIPARTALALSRSMMKGQKWKVFLLDMSFFPWVVLSGLTLGFLNDLYLSPYQSATAAELYFCLREKALAEELPNSEYLNDNLLLSAPPSTPTYPVAQFPIPEHPRRQWLTRTYKRSYSAVNIVLIFFSFSVAGFLWEMVYEFFVRGAVEKRGTLLGPWLPIYGIGGIIALLLLKRWADKPPLLFSIALVAFGALEYFTGWLLETMYKVRWWDYDGYFLNINGRICLEGLLFFASAASIAVYVLGPILDDALSRIPIKIRVGVSLPLLVLFLADATYSMIHPNLSAAVPLSGEDTSSVLPQSSNALHIPANALKGNFAKRM